MKRIGLDLDGVLYNWHSSLYDYYRLYMNFQGTFNDFWTSGVTSFSTETWTYLLGIDTLYSNRFPTADCINFLEAIKNRFEIYYITSRPKSIKLTTEQYLRRFKFPFNENLIFNDNKVNVARLLGLSYAVDDRASQIESLSKVTTAIIVAKPWNKHIWNDYPTVFSLMDILDYLED